MSEKKGQKKSKNVEHAKREKGGMRSRVLIVVIVALCLGVVALVGFVLWHHFGGGDDAKEEGTTTEASNYTVGEDCEGNDGLSETDSVSNCLMERYYSGDEEEILSDYAEKINRDFGEGDYASALDLISNRAMLYILSGKCDEAMGSLNDERIANAPEELRVKFYGKAREYSMMCEDTDKMDYYGEMSGIKVEIPEPEIPEVPGVEK